MNVDVKKKYSRYGHILSYLDLVNKLFASFTTDNDRNTDAVVLGNILNSNEDGLLQNNCFDKNNGNRTSIEGHED
jgi:hypothetical protein